MGLPIAHKCYPIPLKNQKFKDKEIRQLEKAGCISKSLSPWAIPLIILPKKPDPWNPQKQQLYLGLDYQSLNKSVNTIHHGNSVISYYLLPNITHLLAGLQRFTIFSSLHVSSGYHHISLTPEAKPKTTFATPSGKWYWNMVVFDICLLPGVFCYLVSQVLSGLYFCFASLDDILFYSASWKEHPWDLEAVFIHLKAAYLKTKLRKC